MISRRFLILLFLHALSVESMPRYRRQLWNMANNLGLGASQSGQLTFDRQGSRNFENLRNWRVSEDAGVGIPLVYEGRNHPSVGLGVAAGTDFGRNDGKFWQSNERVGLGLAYYKPLDNGASVSGTGGVSFRESQKPEYGLGLNWRYPLNNQGAYFSASGGASFDAFKPRYNAAVKLVYPFGRK